VAAEQNTARLPLLAFGGDEYNIRIMPTKLRLEGDLTKIEK
jgi:hypothetical protein